MPRSPKIAYYCISSGDFSSGEESDCSFVTAFEEFTEGLASNAGGFATGEIQGCNGTCRVDVKTQTSNCEFCRLNLPFTSQQGDETDESVSPATSSSSSSSLTTITPTQSAESDLQGEELSATGESLSTHTQPKLIDKEKAIKSTGFLIVDTEGNNQPQSMSGVRQTFKKTSDLPKQIANRSINSVARIIVADSVDRGTETHRTGAEQQHIDDFSREDGIMWRTGSQTGPEFHGAEMSQSQEVKSHQKTSMTSNNAADGNTWRTVTHKVSESHRAEVSQPYEEKSYQNTSMTSNNIWRRPGDVNESTLVNHTIWTVENLHEMWSQGKLCDVTISTSTGKEFLAHSLVLTLHSGYFGNIFSRSDSAAQRLWEITLDDSIRDTTFANILRFMYSSVVQINSDTISDLLQASIKLSVYRLTRLCMDYVERITVDNCLVLLEIVEKIGLNDHIVKTRSFIYDNILDISTTESFLSLPIERVTTLLAEDNLNVTSEVDVYSVAKRWIQRNQDADMKCAPVVMKTVRLELFSPEELATNVESVEWLMEIPEVRVQVLEAYRYLSLAASCEETLRPPAPRCRARGDKKSSAVGGGGIEQRRSYDDSKNRHNVSTSMSISGGLGRADAHARGGRSDASPKNDASTSMSGKMFPPSKHASLSDASPKNNASTSMSGKMFPPSKHASLPSPRQEHQINTSQDRNHGTHGALQREREPSAIMLQDSMEELTEKSSRKDTSKGITSKTNKTTTKRSKGTLRKPLSDYRITSANPKALTRGPQPWPAPNNLIPSGPEDETSDLILVSGGVSTDGDVDHPGKLMEIFDPERAQWRDSINAPVARNHHVVHFLQDSIYVIGGSDPHAHGADFIKPVNTTYRYDLRLGEWTQTAPMTSPRIFHQVGALLGQLYVVGGQNHKGRTLDSVETYAPISNNWRQVAAISTPRYAVAMTTYGQRLWVAGGYCEQAGSEMVDTVEYFNPYVEEWTSVKSLRAPRCHANLLVARGHLYLVGGYVMDNNGVEKYSTIDVYDEERKVWRFVSDMEHGRHDGKTVAWHDKIYVFGARSDDDEERPLTRVDCFDTNEVVWKRQITELASARFGHACCIIPSRSATNWL